jgi:hypothetical protein
MLTDGGRLVGETRDHEARKAIALEDGERNGSIEVCHLTEVTKGAPLRYLIDGDQDGAGRGWVSGAKAQVHGGVDESVGPVNPVRPACPDRHVGRSRLAACHDREHTPRYEVTRPGDGI